MSFLRLVGAGILFLLFRQLLKILSNAGVQKTMGTDFSNQKTDLNSKNNAIDVSFIRRD